MAVRETRPPCPTCPERRSEQVAEAVNHPRVLAITSQGEGERLWKHVLFGTQTCLGMIHGYAELEMPGDPLPALCQLRDYLSNIISILESRNAHRPAQYGPLAG